jgi:hypothetical protein
MKTDFEERKPSDTHWVPQKFRQLLKEPLYTSVIMATGVFFLTSIIIHFPINNSPQFYSDFLGSFWGRMVGNTQIHEVVVGIPYVDYMFEYPPICGLIVWLGGWASGGSQTVFAAIEFGILLIFAVLTSHVVYQFLGYLKLGHNRQLLFSIFAPSLLFYGAYNFDIVQTFFMILSLYWFVAEKRTNWSALSLGLAVATKLSPAILLPVILQEMHDRTSRIKYTVIMGATVAALNVPFAFANFQTWLAGYEFLRTWGLEDSFLVWIFNNSDSWVLAKEISYALLGLSAIAVYIFFRQKPLLVRAFMLLGLFILFSYIATPQMNLDLLPLFSVVPMIPLSLFYLYELADVGIIVSWFAFSNSTLPGVPQTFALLRQIYLAVIIGILGFSRKSVDIE